MLGTRQAARGKGGEIPRWDTAAFRFFSLQMDFYNEHQMYICRKQRPDKHKINGVNMKKL